MSYERLNITDFVDKWDVAKVQHLEDAIISNEEAIANLSNITQVDWSQNDASQTDFIKNRICYDAIGDTYAVETPDINTYYKLWDFGLSDDEFLAEWNMCEFYYENITKTPGRTLENALDPRAYQMSTIFIGLTSDDGYEGGQYLCDALSVFNNSAKKIDEINYYFAYPAISFYFIFDLTKLSDEYKTHFTERGIYIITNNKMPYRVTSGILRLDHTMAIANHFIPSTIARVDQLPKSAVSIANLTEAPTAEDFNNLLQVLRDAGYLATK